jgi:tRNA pseudouridine13 synthase
MMTENKPAEIKSAENTSIETNSSWNFDWPKPYPDTQATAVLKAEPEHFQVDEIPLIQPQGEGEHVYIYIRKKNVNTHWVAKLIAKAFGVKEMDVSYAGMKDRHAVTTQWFSVYAPKSELVLTERPFEGEDVEVIQQVRHSKKLRRGDLLGNRFKIRLTDLQGDQTAIDANLNQIKQQGVANYFGAQRFGHDGGNMDKALSMLTGERRERNKQKRSIYLSAARSYIFNEVLAARIAQGLWGKSIAGDIDVEGQSVDSAELATAPMWGRGKLSSAESCLALETQIAESQPELCDGLEHAGLNQERRHLVSTVEGLSWCWHDQQQLELTFSLAAGQYATSVLDAFVTVTEPDRLVD